VFNDSRTIRNRSQCQKMAYAKLVCVINGMRVLGGGRGDLPSIQTAVYEEATAGMLPNAAIEIEDRRHTNHVRFQDATPRKTRWMQRSRYAHGARSAKMPQSGNCCWSLLTPAFVTLVPLSHNLASPLTALRRSKPASVISRLPSQSDWR